MKILILLLLAFLPGCAGVGTMMQGMGQGLQDSAHRDTTFDCTQNRAFNNKFSCEGR